VAGDDLKEQLARLDRALKSRLDQAAAEAAKAVGRTGLEMWREVVRNSPVATGRFRAGWNLGPQPSRAKPPAGLKSYPPPAEPRLSGRDLELWLVNNVDYGPDLEASRGLLRSAVERQRRVFKTRLSQALNRANGGKR